MAIEDKTSSNVSKRGFAALDTEQRKKIASMGGKAAHEKGTAHQFTSEEAAAAGRKRGQNLKKMSPIIVMESNQSYAIH
jgi:general stress protein YciG